MPVPGTTPLQVCDYVKWEADGTKRLVHDLLRDRTRRRVHGRIAQPTAAVVDAQS